MAAYGDDVFAAGFQIDAKLAETVTRLIENVKPVRAHFSLGIGESFETDAFLRGGLRLVRVHRRELDPAPRGHAALGTIHARGAHRVRLRAVHEHIPAARLARADGETILRADHRARTISRITHDFQVTEGAAYAV